MSQAAAPCDGPVAIEEKSTTTKLRLRCNTRGRGCRVRVYIYTVLGNAPMHWVSSDIHGRFTDRVLWLLHGDGVLPGVTVDCHRGLRPLTHEDIRARFGLFTYLVHWFTTARTHARMHARMHSPVQQHTMNTTTTIRERGAGRGGCRSWVTH